MKDQIVKFWTLGIELLYKYKSFIIYSVIGVLGVSVDFGLYALFNYIGIPVILSNFLSSTFAIINNFLLNAFFNFKKRDRMFRRFVTFYMVGFFGIGVTSVILYVFVTLLHFDKYLVKALSLIVIVTMQYNLNKRISFKDHE